SVESGLRDHDIRGLVQLIGAQMEAGEHLRGGDVERLNELDADTVLVPRLGEEGGGFLAGWGQAAPAGPVLVVGVDGASEGRDIVGPKRGGHGVDLTLGSSKAVAAHVRDRTVRVL